MIWLLYLLLGIAAIAIQGQGLTPQSANTADARIAQQAAGTDKEIVAFQNGLLTVRVKQRHLASVLTWISQRSRIAIIDEADGSERISVDLQKLPVDEALRRILVNQDAFYFYGKDKEGTALRAVWVYPAGHGAGIEPVPPDKWASTKEFELGLSSKDPKVRGEAIEVVIERKGQGAMDAVLAALTDESEYVRTQALYYAQQDDLELPPDRLSDLALTDVSPDVRVLALQVLATTPYASDVAQRALNDPNPSVQTVAKEILATVTAAPAAAPYRRPQQ